MKKITNLDLAFLLFAVIAISLMMNCKSNQKKIPYTDIPVEMDCQCDTSWFPHSRTPPPKEGANSPFDTKNSKNCDFHRWSWQKFLWLTKPVGNDKVLFEEELVQVGREMDTIPPEGGVSLVLTEALQAGTNGVLISNANFNDNGEADTVYYSMHINDILQHTADSVVAIIKSDLSRLNNFITFPIGALELKVSWIKLSAIPKDRQPFYYTSKAFIKPTGETTTVALLGMHVVGVVKNHPEFIWATFEHMDMAPFYDWSNTTVKGPDVPVTSRDEKLFFKKRAMATINDIQWNTDTSSGPHNIFTVYNYGIPRIEKDSFMKTSQDEPENYNHIRSINSCVTQNLGDDVWNNYFYNGSIWINTDSLTALQQADTIVALGNNIRDVSPGKIAKGSTAAFNNTMETFIQVTPPPPSLHGMNGKNRGPEDVFNCFLCHNAPATIPVVKDGHFKVKSPTVKSPLYVSHIFRSYISYRLGVQKEEINVIRIKEFLKVLEEAKESD